MKQYFKEKNRGKILLIASSVYNDEDWIEVTRLMISTFKERTGAYLKELHLPHMMHWEEPKLIEKEILNFFQL